MKTPSDNLIGYREVLALRSAARGPFYADGYGPMFEAAMVCQRLGLLAPCDWASCLHLTDKGGSLLVRVPQHVEDGWSLEVAHEER